MAEEVQQNVEPEPEQGGDPYVDIEPDQPVWQNLGGDH